MRRVGIRALKQNASAVVAAAAHGEALVVTDRGRDVAQIGPLPSTTLAGMLERGEARPPKRRWSEVPAPTSTRSVSAALAELRDAEQY